MVGELIAAIVAGCVAIVSAFVSLVISKIEAKKANVKIEKLEDSIEQGGVYYVICPNCGTKIYLKDQQIKRED